MKKSTLLAGVAILVVVVGGWLLVSRSQSPKPVTADYKNITYTIEGQPVPLVNGTAETEAVPGSSSKYMTTYFGNEAKGDLNGDGLSDIAFILTQFTGGSGNFFYVVAALQNTDGSYAGTSAVMLGDRIAPQSTEIKDGQLVVNYADRKPGEPMVTTPSVGITKYLKVNGVSLVETSR